MPPEQQPAPEAPQPTAPVRRLGKFAASKLLVRESWAILTQDREILWFPVLSMLASIAAFVVMGALFFYTVMGGDVHAFDEGSESDLGLLGYVIAIGYYTVMFFIVNFFQAGIYIIAHGRMNGSDLTFADGMQGAQRASGKILLWSLISATVGVVLRALAERSKLLGRIVLWLLGAAWNILTYFSLPALVIEQVSVVDSFKVSAATIRKTWGETLILNVGMGLFFGLLLIGGLTIGVVCMVLVPVAPAVVALGILMVVFVIAISVVSSALGAIFKLALFEYARTGQVPQGFSPELIQNAVKR